MGIFGYLILLHKKQLGTYPKINKRVGPNKVMHVLLGRKKFKKRTRIVTLLLGASMYLDTI